MSRKQQDDARDRIARLLRTEGVEAAYEALIAVCRDPKASSQARSHAASTLFRAANFIAKDTDQEKELHEMTAEELDNHIRRQERRLRIWEEERGLDPDKPDDDEGDIGVFN